VSDFIHDPTTKVSVINGPEGSTIIEQETTDFAHPLDEDEKQKVEDIELPEAVPYRASTPESDKRATDQLLEEKKITEDEHKERIKEIDRIAKDKTISPQEPEEEPAPKKVTEEDKTKAQKEADTHKDAVKK
jgi:hypothetical protein